MSTDRLGTGSHDVERAVVRLLAREHGLFDARLDRFSPEHPTYLATTASARRVVRVGRDLRHHVAALRALETAGHPAPRVLPATDGSFVRQLRTGEQVRDVVVLTFTEGTTPQLDGVDLRALGTALGQLHARAPEILAAAALPEAGLPATERAVMLPDNELGFGLAQLLPVENRLPNRATAARWQQLVDACHAGRRPLDGLTQTFLHGDAHPWNGIIRPSGDGCFIDWDSAGPGPAIIDLAFLVLSCATGGLIHPYRPTDPAAVGSLLDGYRQQMTLGADDLDALDRAIQFRILVCAAVGFGHYLLRGIDPLTEPSIHWSLRRLEESPRIADTIRSVLSP